jgi:repressor LexA
MNRSLTHQQRAVYDFIRSRIVDRGYGPTVREIGEHMHIKSPNGVVCHLRALERKGMITRAANKSRSIELLDRVLQQRLEGLPIKGDVIRGTYATGMLSADMAVSLKQLTTPGSYALLVRDNSLLESQITRGDYLIIEPQEYCLDGQLVLAEYNGSPLGSPNPEVSGTFLVKCCQEATRIRLEPVSSLLNASHFYVEEARIVGVLAGVIRLLKGR